METVIVCLWSISFTILVLFMVGWFFFRGYHWVYRGIEKSIRSTVDHSREVVGHEVGICNGCDAPIQIVNGIWRHVDKAHDVYISCLSCGYKQAGARMDVDDACPVCSEGFPMVANIIHAAHPRLRFSRNLKHNYYALRLYLARKAEAFMDYCYDYYNTQKPNTIPDWYYHVACRLWRKHNVVRCRELPPTYHEPSDLMPHVMFELLQQYVELEDPEILTCPDEFVAQDHYGGGDVEMNADKYHHETRVEIKNLYLWWTKTRHQQQKEIDDFMDTCYGEGWQKHKGKDREKMLKHLWKMEDQQTKDLENAMIKLVKVHGALWQ
jgi:hypothetical protein